MYIGCFNKYVGYYITVARCREAEKTVLGLGIPPTNEPIINEESHTHKKEG